MNRKMLGLAFIMLFGGVLAFTADGNIIVSNIVSWGGSVTKAFTLTKGVAFYFTSTDKIDSCSGSAVFYTSDVNVTDINFTVTDLNESGLDINAELGGRNYDINSSQSVYDLPVNAVGEKFCIIGKVKGSGRYKIVTSDINVITR